MAKWTEQKMARRIADMDAKAQNEGREHCDMCPLYKGFKVTHRIENALSSWRSSQLPTRKEFTQSLCNLCSTVMDSGEECPCLCYGKGIKAALKKRLALYGYEVVDK